MSVPPLRSARRAALAVVLVLLILAPARTAAPQPAPPSVLLRYRLRPGDRFLGETRLTTTGPFAFESVVRTRSEVVARSAGARAVHHEVLASTGPPGLVELDDQVVPADGRRLWASQGAEPGGAARGRLGAVPLPEAPVRVGDGWEVVERWRDEAGATTLRVRATLAGLQVASGRRIAVLRFVGTLRTVGLPAETGVHRSVVSVLTGERRFDLDSGLVGESRFDLRTSLHEDGPTGESVTPTGRAVIEQRFWPLPPARSSR